MADVSLNGLKVKTDSLPNDWYVSLINPKSSEPAEIMTVAKFIEMFTPKQPEATESSKGVLSSGVYKNIISKYKDYTNPVGYYKAIKIKTSLKLIRYGGYNFYCKLGQTQNSLFNQIVDINIKVWDYNFERTAPISLGQNFIESIAFCVDSDDTFTIYVNFNATLNLAGGVTSLLFRLQGNSNSVVSIEGLNEKYTPGSHSKEIITNIPNTINSYSSSPNALTDIISTSPVLESRQVRSTCLQNHLYQILLPTCLGKREKMVQFQLELNHPKHRNSMSGQSTRSEKLSWNYKQKTRDLNKSSISLTIARYNKCNLPRAGPPRLIN